jgi:hypothetical protein
VRTHPHAEATYEVVAIDTGGFGVKVSIPDTQPTTVSRFETEALAEAWIESHKARIQSQNKPGAIFRRPRPAG